jgi:Coenzyme PQQ synthesis protein D (PqqD)
VTELLATCYDKDPNVVSREIAGERILVPIRKQAADMAAIYVLNETGVSIWNLLDGQHSLADIREALVQAYDVEPATAESDLLEVVGQLQELGAIRIA